MRVMQVTRQGLEMPQSRLHLPRSFTVSSEVWPRAIAASSDDITPNSGEEESSATVENTRTRIAAVQCCRKAERIIMRLFMHNEVGNHKRHLPNMCQL